MLQLEENITLRGVKSPRFKFNIKGDSVQPVSLSGRDAQLILAETEALESAGCCPLFEGVWTDETLPTSTLETNTPAEVLCRAEYHPHFFQKNSSSISLLDASTLLFSSLNSCVRILRSCESLEKFQSKIPKFEFWAETYYQTSILLFQKDALTPYKLKLLLIPQIVGKGYLQAPWSHMVESFEKSDNHANKDFQTRKMRGGGHFWHWDPSLMDILFSYKRIFKLGGIVEHDGCGVDAAVCQFKDTMAPLIP